MPRSPLPEASPVSLLTPLTARRLTERGVDPARRPDEDHDLHVARLETGLMALFRDQPDEQVFRSLHELASGPLRSWIAGLATGRAAALELEQLVQDTFVNVYRYASGFRDEQPRSFRVWSRTIASNVLRRARARRVRVEWQAMPIGPLEPGDLHADPHEHAVRDEEGRSLAAAWCILLSQYARAYQELGARDRRALELIEIEGVTYSEASAQLGVGLSNMKMILFRARRRIRASIGARFSAREVKARRLAG